MKLAQLVIPHLAEIRNSRDTLHLRSLLSFVKQTIASTVGKGTRADVSWDIVFDGIANLIQEANAVVPTALENESVQKSAFPRPCINTFITDEVRP